MLEGSDIPRSPAWWFKVLASEMQDRRHGRSGSKKWSRTMGKPSRVRPPLDMLHDHLQGDPPLLGCADGWRDGFREVARLGRLNVAALIVEAKANRMALRGFRTSAADDELGDQLAREVMRANNLKVKARETHTGTLSLADAYVMITPPSRNRRIPVITAEDARECITAEDPATGETIAALKLYRDDWDSEDVGHLFIRTDNGLVLHYRATKQGATSLTSNRFVLSRNWTWDPDVNGERVPDDRMPIIRFPNRDGVGEYERHLDTLDRINDQILNKLVIAKIQAFRQRAVKGLPSTRRAVVDGAVTDVDIDYSDAFIAGPGELWQVPSDVDFWESQPVDMRPLLESIKDDLEHLAAVTSTPLHIITPDAASGSAEGAGLMREEHVYAVEACRDNVDRAWAEVMATCFAFMGDHERSNAEDIDPIWGPVERYSLAERADASSKAKGLPVEAIQRDIWQYDPAEIPDLRIMAGRDLLTAPATSPAAGEPAAPAEPAQPTLFDGLTGGADPAAAG